MAKKIAVIGAGFGGLSVAAYLAQAGYEVTVYEKNKASSAQTRVIKKKGFTFDLNPSWYLMPELFDDWFRDFNTSAHEQYEVTALNPSYKIFTHETAYEVTSWPDVSELFDALEPGSGEHLEKLLHKSEKLYRHWLHDMQQDAHAPHIPKIFKGNLRQPYHAAIAKALKNQDLQHIVELPTILMGASPQATPGLYRHLDYAMLATGLGHPHGGMSMVAAAMQKIAKQLGVTFRFSTPVTKLITEADQITGVEVKGETVPYDLVVSNADMAWVEAELLESTERSHHPHYWQKRSLTPSAVVACLGVKRSMPELQHHNVLLDMEWGTFLNQVFETKEWSPKPIVFIDNPSKTNSKLAPAGHENLIIHVPIAAGLNPTDEQLERLLLSVIGRMQEQLGYEFMNNVVLAEIKAQDFFEETFHSYQGTQAGLSPNLAQLTTHRPGIRSKKLRNLYYIGSYSTPAAQPAVLAAAGKALANIVK